MAILVDPIISWPLLAARNKVVQRYDFNRSTMQAFAGRWPETIL